MSASRPTFRQRRAAVQARAAATSRNPQGWVYASLGVHLPGVVKVGMTSRHPKKRFMESSAHPALRGLGWRRVEIWAARASDKRVAEGMAHSLLEAYRLPGERELFRTDIERAKAALREACGCEPERVALG